MSQLRSIYFLGYLLRPSRGRWKPQILHPWNLPAKDRATRGPELLLVKKPRPVQKKIQPHFIREPSLYRFLGHLLGAPELQVLNGAASHVFDLLGTRSPAEQGSITKFEQFSSKTIVQGVDFFYLGTALVTPGGPIVVRYAEGSSCNGISQSDEAGPLRTLFREKLVAGDPLVAEPQIYWDPAHTTAEVLMWEKEAQQRHGPESTHAKKRRSGGDLWNGTDAEGMKAMLAL